ncbi:MAG: hypothetical protein BWY27_01433 [Bacteroidetes bacterium ADurb.Bin234]|nr:MAG: hypothetical protein BWY27_01433 [Bacteroidetes bacterium ADurb.Bin234]
MENPEYTPDNSLKTTGPETPQLFNAVMASGMV